MHVRNKFNSLLAGAMAQMTISSEPAEKATKAYSVQAAREITLRQAPTISVLSVQTRCRM